MRLMLSLGKGSLIVTSGRKGGGLGGRMDAVIKVLWEVASHGRVCFAATALDGVVTTLDVYNRAGDVYDYDYDYAAVVRVASICIPRRKPTLFSLCSLPSSGFGQ